MGIIHLFLSLSISKMVCNPSNNFILSKIFIVNISGLVQHGNGLIMMTTITLYPTDHLVEIRSGVLGQAVLLHVAQDDKLGKIISTRITRIILMMMIILMMKI